MRSLGIRRILACLPLLETTALCGCMYNLYVTSDMVPVLTILDGHEIIPAKAAQAKADFPNPRISHGRVLFDQRRANFDH
jgi:hypothetical protein